MPFSGGEDFGERRHYDPAFSGPVKHRSCTDIVCLLLLVAFLAGWVAVGAFAYSRGDPALLLHAMNSSGFPCGKSGTELSDKPYVNFFNIAKCNIVTITTNGCPTPQVCVKACPDTTFDFSYYKNGKKTCTQEIKDKLVCRQGTNKALSCSDLINKGYCASFVIKSAAVLGRCIPNLAASDIDKDGMVKDQNGKGFISVSSLKLGSNRAGLLAGLAGLGQDAFSDLQHTWWVIVAACAAAALLSLLWIVLLRFVAAVLIWTAFLGCLAAVCYGCVVTYMRYSDLRSVAGDAAEFNPLSAFTEGFGSILDRPNTWLALFICCCAVAVVLLLVLIVLQKRVRIATRMLGLASRAVMSSLSTLWLPLVPWLLQMGVIAVFISLALYIASMGDASYKVRLPRDCACPGYTNGTACLPLDFQGKCPVTDACVAAECSFVGYTGHTAAIYLHLYNLVGLLWGLFFCSAVGEMVLAGVFSAWYFTFDKKHDLASFPLASSTSRTLRYHLGTLAFGSLIIAIIRLIRLAFDYISRKTKQYVDNVVARAVVCLCKCCLWCLEKFMRFINRNAYIVTAMYGTNFCVSAKDAFFLLMRNVLRVVAVDASCDVMLLLGKLVVTALVTVGAFYFLDDRIPVAGVQQLVPTTQHSWVPLATIAVAGYLVTGVFFSVYSMAVDTVFLCFLEDLERNDGSAQKPYYMSKSLMKLLGKKNKKAKKGKHADREE